MSDTSIDQWVPDLSVFDASTRDQLSSADVAARYRTVVKLNPYMANNPEAVLGLVSQPGSFQQITTTAAASYGMLSANSMQAQLGGMTPARQRAVWAGLPRNQQMALAQMGYEPPQEDDGTWFGDLVGTTLGAVGQVAGGALGAVNTVLGPVVGPALDGINWLASQPGHFYRAIRLGDDVSQTAAVIGGIAGAAAAVVAAPFTGGGSLATLGIIGGGALLGGTAASVAVQGPSDWWRAFRASADGERTFLPDARRRASELLGDPRLVGFAADLSHAELSLPELLDELAGMQSSDENSQLRKLNEIVGEMAEPGTPAYEQAFKAALNAIQQPEFQEALLTLQRGKISPGRDLARAFRLNPESGAYSVVSGLADAAFTIAVDPTLLAGHAVHFARARRYGVTFVEEGAHIVSNFRQVAATPKMRATFDEIARLVDAGDMSQMNRIFPEYSQLWDDLRAHRNRLAAIVDEDRAARVAWDGQAVVDYFDGSARLVPFLKGIGTVRSADTIVLKPVAGWTKTMRGAISELRSFAGGLSDPQLEKRAAEILGTTTDADLIAHLTPVLDPGLSDYGLMYRKMYGDRAGAAYEAGRRLSTRPTAKIGDLIQKVMTQVPESRAIAFVGAEAPRDIKAFTELATYAGMPSWARSWWADQILSGDNPGMATNLMLGFVDEMLRVAGIDEISGGKALRRQYLERVFQTYGGMGSVEIGGDVIDTALWGNQLATHVSMPDLLELRKAVKTGMMAKVLGLTELPVISPAINKVWKPSVLLRLGFVQRAAGEEMVAFIARGNMGALGQEAAGRYLGRRELLREATALRDKGLLGLTELQPGHVKMLEALNRGPYAELPAFLRPLGRVLNHFEWTHPIYKQLSRYAEFAEEFLRSGVGVDDAALLRRVGGTSDMTAEAIRRATIAGRPLSRRRFEAAQMLDQVVWGKAHSWRRMVAGGVADEIVEGQRKFLALHGPTIMNEVGAMSHGPIDPGYNTRHSVVQITSDDEGRLTEVPVIIERSHYRGVAKQDRSGQFDVGIHRERAELMDDPAVRRVFTEHISRITGSVEVPREQWAQHWRSMRDVLNDRYLREIFWEYATEGRDDTYLAMVHRLANADFANAHELDVAGALGRPVLGDVLDASGLGDGARAALAGPLEWLDSLPTAQREFVTQALRNAEMQGADSRLWQDLNAWLAGADDVNPWYSSWEDASDAIRQELRNALADPRMQGEHAMLQRLALERRGDQLESGTRLMYAVPHGIHPYLITGDRAVFDQQIEKVIADAMARGDVARARTLDARRDEIFTIASDLASERITNPVRLPSRMVTADRDLARALMPMLPGVPNVEPTVVRLPDTVLNDASKIGRDVLADADGQRVVVAMRPTVIDRYTVDVDDLEARMDELATLQERYLRMMFSRGSNRTMIARGRAKEAGVGEAVMYRPLPSGQRAAIEPGSVVHPDVTVVDDANRPVSWGDKLFFDEAESTVAPGGDPMWELLGPMAHDTLSDMAGESTLIPRQFISPQGGELYPADGVIPIRRSRASDVRRVPAEHLPDYAMGHVIRPDAPASAWEKIVRVGFEGFISPMIDALARRPMAAHSFQLRYSEARQASRWLLASETEDAMKSLLPEFAEAIDDARIAKLREAFDIDPAVSDAKALAYVRGLSDADVKRVHGRALRRGVTTMTEQDVRALTAGIGASKLAGMRAPLTYVDDGSGVDQFVAQLESLPWSHADGRVSRAEFLEVTGYDTLASNNDTREQIDTIFNAFNRRRVLSDEIGDYAAIGAINDMVPFIDSHEFRSQFAEAGRGFLPFWYAEENFLKRWARGLADEGPAMIRRVQLGYMGLREVGAVRTDEQGRDWFVYPGSGVLAEVLAKIPGVPDGMDVMFQSPTDTLLPGMSSKFGIAQVSPLLSVPAGVLTGAFPEFSPIRDALVPPEARDLNPLEQMIPSVARNLFIAINADENNSVRYASAMMEAIANLEATGHGLPDGATPDQVDDFLDSARNHARIIMVGRALMGFAAPGQISTLYAGDTASFTGLGAEDPSEVLATRFSQLVKGLGLEEGTLAYLAENPYAQLHDIFNPEVFTVGKSESTSGAPLPASADAAWYDANADYLSQFDYAGPWLIPEVAAGVTSTRGRYGYDQQMVSELRSRRSPREFLLAAKYKAGASTYFPARSDYLDAVSMARAEGDDERVRTLNAQWSVWSSTFKAQHPWFAAELESPDARLRRSRVIDEMRVVLADPLAPQSPKMTGLRLMMDSYDSFVAARTELAEDGSARGRLRLELARKSFSESMSTIADQYPDVAAFWTGVLRPEASLE